MQAPMLTDFAIRMALGLSALLLVTSHRAVPLAFFRTHCLVTLGLLVLGALAAADGSRMTATAGFVAGLGVATYLASIAWGLGLPRLAVPLTLLIAVGASARLIDEARAPLTILWTANALAKLSSSFLMGSSVSAMLLGHYYLTAPTMSIDPLGRFTKCLGWGLALRAAVGVAGLAMTYHQIPSIEGMPLPVPVGPSPTALLLVRWGMGFAAPALATWMAWKTEQIRSTQSATGILYIATTLVFFGELTAMVLARDGLLT